MQKIIFLLAVISFNTVSSQKITSGKKIKSTREKLLFLNDSIQNYKLFSIDGDYGHSGFTGSEATIDRFYQHWYNESFVHYINNKRDFDDEGKLIHEIWFDKADDFEREYDYKYNESDSLSQIIEKRDKEGKSINYTNITYNFLEKKQSTLTFWNDYPNDFQLELYSYDDKDRLKTIEFLSEEGRSKINYYNYNSKDKIRESIIHQPLAFKDLDGRSYTQVRDSLGTFFVLYKNVYDESGRLIERHDFCAPEYKKGSYLTYKTFFKYDDFDNLLEEKRIPSFSKMTFLSTYRYDKKNRKIFESDATIGHDSGWDFEKQFFYKGNNLVKIIIKNKKQKPVIVDLGYKYDKYGNWIEQTKSINGKKLFVWKREIVYYQY
ncbi:hypothetical protein FEDK69T_02700 [Flavobacterium enshiense DK69]|uniref:Uncharacterized protein n=1 Tax=Flavobacterium enshiense DK69 TaxID=1107311 RepID=V6SDH7_9FLAO|nr:hypothetical protein [Flavobacterium enshiense]ESU24718.1 hypothetical protein FEDK69T_02700 [Flavobacterium enshiense DK69]KGO96824.1 hypothetical protein Q767_03720 [Flavobacterium enshiense DK69]